MNEDNLMKLTKRELVDKIVNTEKPDSSELHDVIERLSKEVAELKKDKSKMKEIEAQVAADMSYKWSPDEEKRHRQKQAEKDFYKKMTKGQFTSREKYLEYQNKFQKSAIDAVNKVI